MPRQYYKHGTIPAGYKDHTRYQNPYHHPDHIADPGHLGRHGHHNYLHGGLYGHIYNSHGPAHLDDMEVRGSHAATFPPP